MTDQQNYRLRDGVETVVRSGLVLEAGETIESYPDVLDEHGDVLEATDDNP